jgi:hypothetical protein
LREKRGSAGVEDWNREPEGEAHARCRNEQHGIRQGLVAGDELARDEKSHREEVRRHAGEEDGFCSNPPASLGPPSELAMARIA